MNILTTPDPFLRRVAKPVETYDKKTNQQVNEMVTLLQLAKDPEGVGLAATQIGLDKRIFVVLDDNKYPLIFINPEIVEASKKLLSQVYTKPSKRWMEGCLSIPKFWGFVDRPYSIKLKYQVPRLISSGVWELETVTQEFEDAYSAYIQHERDHLDGILFTDHIIRQKGILYLEDGDKLHPVDVTSLSQPSTITSQNND
jgi:peptide deformylase